MSKYGRQYASDSTICLNEKFAQQFQELFNRFRVVVRNPAPLFSKDRGSSHFPSFLRAPSPILIMENATRSLVDRILRRWWSSAWAIKTSVPRGYITVAEGACPVRQGDFEKSRAA